MRLRDSGITVGQLSPGSLNAITDVEGVRVGVMTLVHGDGPLVVGEGPIRTGVTVIVPHEGIAGEPLFAGCHRLNGNGELTGLEWVRESGTLTTPVAITNTH
ncbi:MAG: P1 family peptidase, partial [Actinomycetota bacterium]